MKFFLGLIACAAVAHGLTDDQQFDAFIQKYNRNYATEAERAKRFTIFQRNLRDAERNQAMEKAGGAKHGVTQFSDMTKDEFLGKFANSKKPAEEPKGAQHYKPDGPLTTSANTNWCNSGACTPVKNQGQCGSCWAFSTTEQVESMSYLQNGNLPTLAPQQIVDCDSTDSGCNGGWPYNAYQYLMNAGGFDTESSYPYTGQDGQCSVDQSSFATRVTGWNYVGQNDEATMIHYAATTGPISICIDCSAWMSYQGGVLTNCQAGQPNHCVQAVGVNTGAQTPYWVVRNSWGGSWGENGYIRLELNQDCSSITDSPTTCKTANVTAH